jgi:RNA polymerase sigma factor (sigma-70 family)
MVARCACGAAPMATRPQSAEQARQNAGVLEYVLVRHRARLLRAARHHAQRPADAEEALQSACLLFLERYNPDCDPLAWLHTTVKREAWALARRASRRREVGFDELSSDPDSERAERAELLPSQLPRAEERAERREAHVCFVAAFRTLKPAERAALLLLGLGYTYHEIMARQGWSYTKTNRCISEGRAALRKLAGRS